MHYALNLICIARRGAATARGLVLLCWINSMIVSLPSSIANFAILFGASPKPEFVLMPAPECCDIGGRQCREHAARLQGDGEGRPGYSAQSPSGVGS